MLSSPNRVSMSLKCVTAFSWVERYLGVSLGPFAIRLWVMMIVIGLDYSTLIMMGFVSSLFITFLISATLASS